MPGKEVFSDDDLRAALARGPSSTAELAGQFGVTRQAVLKRLIDLEVNGDAIRSGAGRATRWQAPGGRTLTWPLHDGSDESAMWQEAWDASPELAAVVNDNTQRVLRYAATEMLNNAIDHSAGTAVELRLAEQDGDISLRISDDGVGAFPHVQQHFGLPSLHDAVAHITKGRQTTAPAFHSGQGLFFTSKVVDHFELVSAGLAWRVDNVRSDQALLAVSNRPGTQVLLRTAANGSRTLKEAFDRFSDPETYDFDRSTFRVSLGEISDEFVSRSEAKRLAAGLESYRRVELDFTGVAGVGQGFVDELFRVWAGANPHTELVVVNANDAVRFMVDRGLNR